jgi:Icc-related predicted phosphoesterase
MTLLVIADIHGDIEALSGMLPLIRSSDFILLAGDLTEFGGAQEVDEVISLLGSERLIAVPGNCDRRAARERLAALGVSADGRLVERPGILVAGVGGGLVRTGLTPYERREEELAANLKASLEKGAERAKGGLPLVVLSHQPPKDSGADLRRGVSVGSRALRDILDSERPPLWVCGHIHESPCAARHGRCLLVNPGPAKDGRYALVRLEKNGGGSWGANLESLA